MHVERLGERLSIDSASEAETDQVGRALAEEARPGTVIGLIGPLGAGKTRLVRAFAEALGVSPGAIASPTFVLIHEYEGRLPVYHFDVYRLKGLDEFDALGPSDYWQGDGVCLVEWADKVIGRLPDDAWTVQIDLLGPVARRFEVTFPGGSSFAERLHERLRSRPAEPV
jgi:tRNA threonylcarbamoyladenosine biosynthesis protein TsaE